MSTSSITAASAVSGGDWFCTRAELKTHLGITGTSEDAKLDEIIADVSAMIRSYTDRWLTTKTYTNELYSGDGSEKLYLREYPVTAVSDLRVSQDVYGGAGNSDAFTSDNLWTQNSDYIIATTEETRRNVGQLVSIRGFFPKGYSNVRVGSYTAGYSSIPNDLALACFQFCARVRANAPKGIPLQSEKLGDYSYQTMLVERELSHARKILNTYKRPL